MIQPTAQISEKGIFAYERVFLNMQCKYYRLPIGAEYIVDRSKTSGARYHRVET